MLHNLSWLEPELFYIYRNIPPHHQNMQGAVAYSHRSGEGYTVLHRVVQLHISEDVSQPCQLKLGQFSRESNATVGFSFNLFCICVPIDSQ